MMQSLFKVYIILYNLKNKFLHLPRAHLAGSKSMNYTRRVRLAEEYMRGGDFIRHWIATCMYIIYYNIMYSRARIQ